MLPSSPEEINTKFLIYTTKDRSEKPFLEFHFTDIVGANAVGVNNTVAMPESMASIHEKIGSIQARSAKIIVHGFGSSCSHVWIYEMRAALMAVVSVDRFRRIKLSTVLCFLVSFLVSISVFYFHRLPDNYGKLHNHAVD
jgi:hypothetical protein